VAEEIRLELPARPEFLSLARLVVAGAVIFDPAFTEERIADLRLAVSEAATNAIEAQQRANEANGGDEGITVRCLIDDSTVEVEVTDTGEGFDPSALVAHPPVTDPARLDFERGLGIPLIRLLTDLVEFLPSPDGTTVRMVVNAFPGGGS
jgi:anti-sigma regulatory factor (Ser/Thr protein kinase)